jgi:hypothetical protein
MIISGGKTQAPIVFKYCRYDMQANLRTTIEEASPFPASESFKISEAFKIKSQGYFDLPD